MNVNRTDRGTVWWVDLPIIPGSHVEAGTRPCLIVSDTNNNKHSDVVTVCPLTTKLDTVPNHPKINCRGKVAQVMCEQITTIDISQLGDFVWKTPGDDMDIVERALRNILCLGKQRNNNYRNYNDEQW